MTSYETDYFLIESLLIPSWINHWLTLGPSVITFEEAKEFPWVDQSLIMLHHKKMSDIKCEKENSWAEHFHSFGFLAPAVNRSFGTFSRYLGRKEGRRRYCAFPWPMTVAGYWQEITNKALNWGTKYLSGRCRWCLHCKAQRVWQPSRHLCQVREHTEYNAYG